MVTVKIYGGLGNQLFQYAAGFALAEKLKTPIALDTSFYERDHLRKFLLGEFALPWQPYKPEKHGLPYAKGLQGLWDKAKAISKNYPQTPEFKEKSYHFNEEFKRINKPHFLDGYWQSELYFQSVREELRKILQLKDSQNYANHPLAKSIENNHSIAIHIRRSDYTNKINQQIFYTCPVDYYKKALQCLSKVTHEAHFYLFSDDPDWVKINFQWLQPHTIVSGNSTLQDFFLMQKAQHHIIANSSFSWWAAWLGNKPGQKVISPLLWFKDKSKNTKDLIPKTWIRL